MAHAALQYDDVARLVYIDARHAVTGTGRIVARSGIYHVVGADDEHDVGQRKLPVDLFHLEQLVVRDVRFREKDVHVSRHSSGYRMNRVLHVDAALLEIRCELAHSVLRFGNGEAVTGDDDDTSRVGECDRGVFSGRLPDRTLDTIGLRRLGRGTCTEGSKKYVAHG